MSQLQVTGEAKIRDIQGPVVANSGVITALDGAASQYVRGDGTLADFPTSTGGGSSVSYYLNSSVSQGTIGGVAYRELSKDPIIGAGTDIPIAANGYVANYITDANDPDVVLVPGGNFNCEFYFSVNNNTGNPTTYAELYKYDGTTFTLLGTSAGVPESINQGTTIAPYYFAIPVATAALSVTDRLAIRIYVNVDGRTVTLHTENGHLCQVVTTLSKGMVSLNNLTDQSQYLATGTSGTDFNIVSSGDTHTFNIPSASATNRGLITTGGQTITGSKTFNNAINAESGVLLKNGFTTYSNSYTSLGGNIGNLIISGSISSTPFDNELAFTPSTSNIYEYPNLSGTLALLEGTQTFSGAKTFSLDILVNGLTIGRGAGSIATNTVVGSSALAANTTGYGNTSIGLNNLIANTTGFFNVAIGASSLISNTTGTYNAALGTSSLYNNTTGSNNTAVGQQAGETNTTGSNNTYIGKGSGYNITTGSNNTIIGAFNGTAALANNIVLADGAGNVRYRYDGTNNNLYGNVNFSSTIGNGTYTYTLPAATGTLALTSNLSAYLPLTGGTLTGALSGTSATFIGGTLSNPVLIINGNTSATITGNAKRLAQLRYNAGDGTGIDLGYDATAENGIIAGGTNTNGAGIDFLTYNGSSWGSRFLIAKSGAATFSSSVTANGSFNGFQSGTQNLLIDWSGSSQMVTLTNTELFFGTNAQRRMTITSGGNVGIGTSSPAKQLDVYSSATSNTAQIVTSDASSTNRLYLGTFSNNSYISFGGTYQGGWSANGSNAIANIGMSASSGASTIQFETSSSNGTGPTERMRITTDGAVLVGASSTPSSSTSGVALQNPRLLGPTLFSSGNVSDSRSFVQFINANGVVGQITTSGTSTSYVTSSDYRLKQDLKDYNGLDLVSAIKTYDYEWKSDSTRSYGVIAHELQDILPQAVYGEKDADEMQGVDYSKIVPILIKSIQELQAKIVTLESKIN